MLLVDQEWEKMKVGNLNLLFSQFFTLSSRMTSRLPQLTTPRLRSNFILKQNGGQSLQNVKL